MARPSAVLERLERIEAKVDALIKPPEPPPALLITAREAMRRLNCKTRSSFCRLSRKLGLRPISRNQYRPLDVSNAVIRKSSALYKTP